MESYDLKEYLRADAINYKPISNSRFSLSKLKALLFSDPGSDQKYIWRYIYYLRHVEYAITKQKKQKMFLIH